ncbi:MAG: substrate-binding domain-containing protein, partial [Mariprofundus sp.]|nr:substrate-binding domain-containing protein [Mariprofundus sp.]
EVHFSINGGGSTSGFGQLIDRRVDIGMMSRNLTVEEQQSLGDVQHVMVAVDAVVPVVSHEVQQSGVSRITPSMLADIYRGKITNWKQVGGADRQILLVDKEMHRGTRHVFAQYVLGSPTAAVSPEAIILESNDDVVNIVSGSDQAIAYVSFSYVNALVYGLDLQIDGKAVAATVENIRSGVYPISRKLYVLLPNDASAQAQAFVRFILSVEGQSMVERVGYLPIQ